MKRILYLIVLLCLFSCRTKNTGNVEEFARRPLSSMILKYAKGFSVDFFDGYKRITVYDPWKQGAILERYYLTGNPETDIPDDGKKINTPVNSIVSASSTHYSFLDMLEVTGTLKGICDTKRTYNKKILEALKAGQIADLGDPFRINVERCLMLKPELVMFSAYNQYDENVARLVAAGIPVVYNNEWMEQTLLGRAEWIKFIACFYEKDFLADSLFNIVEANYLGLNRLASSAKTKKPVILSGDNFRGTWYQPGGRSFTAQLFADAGGEYIYKNDTTRGSLPFSFEQVFRDLKDADVWVGATNGKSLKELSLSDQRYTLFKPFREGLVYSYSNRTTPEGGNDFWEGAVARPDGLLGDFIKLFHPELLPEHEMIYIKKLK